MEREPDDDDNDEVEEALEMVRVRAGTDGAGRSLVDSPMEDGMEKSRVEYMGCRVNREPIAMRIFDDGDDDDGGSRCQEIVDKCIA